MKTLLLKLKQAFCIHEYGNGVMNPFIDSNGNHSAVYTCMYCGHKYFKTFNKN